MVNPFERRLAAALALVVLSVGVAAAAPAASHPLDPLSAAEITTTAALVRAHRQFPKGALFPMIALREPDKRLLQRGTPGQPPVQAVRREALAVVLDRAANRTYEVIVDLRARRVTSFKKVPGVQPLVLVEEYETVPKIVKADPRWQAAMRKRGITDFDKVWIDVWAAGHFTPAGQEGARLLRGLSYLKDGQINFYGRPIEGVVAVVNLNSKTVVDLVDTGAVPVAGPGQELDEVSIGKQRSGRKPLLITQPEGPSFTVTGSEVRWENWRFRFAMHPREGLILYQVGYQDGARLRPVLYRAALSEMVVPYGDPDQNWVWRNAFDEGEYGVGRLASPLEPGQDAPANAMLFDADFSDDFGKAYKLEKVIGLYERDGGLLWKHYDSYVYANQSRRARELVIFYIATIGNYDYALSWVFHQDGTLELVADLTGIMLPKGVKEQTMAAGHAHGGATYGHLVAPGVAAPHHQHFFNFRLDLDVDGSRNSVVEMNTEAVPPGADNPEQNAILMRDTPLGRESAAQRDLNMASARKWRIVNPFTKGPLGYQPGYVLAPGENAVPYIAPAAGVRKRARFVDHHVWVTRYRPDERHAAGFYPNQNVSGEGLARYVADDEPLTGEDVVLWYTMGITHNPRPEEWPVMSVHRLGFQLLPAGFFARNPALDVPR